MTFLWSFARTSGRLRPRAQAKLCRNLTKLWPCLRWPKHCPSSCPNVQCLVHGRPSMLKRGRAGFSLQVVLGLALVFISVWSRRIVNRLAIQKHKAQEYLSVRLPPGTSQQSLRYLGGQFGAEWVSQGAPTSPCQPFGWTLRRKPCPCCSPIDR